MKNRKQKGRKRAKPSRRDAEVIYVAGSFRGENAWEVHRNVELSERWALVLARHGYIPLSPHCLYRNFDGTMTDRFWLEATAELLRRCDAIFMLPNWMKSKGAQAELKLAKRIGMPVYGFEYGFRFVMLPKKRVFE